MKFDNIQKQKKLDKLAKQYQDHFNKNPRSSENLKHFLHCLAGRILDLEYKITNKALDKVMVEAKLNGIKDLITE